MRDRIFKKVRLRNASLLLIHSASA
jgi:hypothetical protein